MLLSIVVYTSLAGVLFMLAWRVNAREQVVLARGGAEIPFRHSREMIASVLLLAVVAGARYHTGYDHEAYLNNYLMLRDTGDFMRHNYEPGYVIISRAFAAVGAHYFFFFAFWALLQFGLLYYAMRHHKFLLPWLAVYLVLGPYFLHLMNTMRQGIVECAMVAMVPLIVQRRHWLYLLCTLALTTLHTTALLAIPIYLLCLLPRPKLSQYWHLAIFAACVALGFLPQWFTAVAQWMVDIVPNTHLASYYTSSLQPFVQGEFRHVAWGPSRLSNLALVLSCIWFYPKLREWKSQDTSLPIFYFLAFVGVCLQNIFVNTSFFILRPIEVVSVFIVPMIAYVIAYLYQTRQRVYFTAMAVLAYTYIYIEIYKAVYRPTKEIIPTLYHFCFFN